MMTNLDRATSLNFGELETKNLSECLSVKQDMLVNAVLPTLGMVASQVKNIESVAIKCQNLGISHQILAISAAIYAELLHDNEVLCKLSVHKSDTVRSWAAFIFGRHAREDSLENRLNSVRIFAADIHFGVREWAWMAIRPYLASNLQLTIEIFQSWVKDKDPNIRRFAIESIRPRGVWCEHIKELKKTPQIAVSLLEQLRTDESRYVQDSVSNWLNDASKTQPQWVKELCSHWDHDSSENTKRIIKRALRTVMKKETSNTKVQK